MVNDVREDLALVEAHHAGDRDALPQLLARHHRLIERTAYRIVRDHQRAEDITQEVALRAWQRLPAADRFRHSRQVVTWLCEVASNAALDAHRAAARRFDVATYPFTEWELDAGTPTVPDHAVTVMDRLDLEVTVRTAMAQLCDDGQRDVVLRVDLLEQTAAQVATATGVGVSTVRTRLHRGRQKLRHILAGAR